eukprot:11821499-Prorocentrum_lima.AAC.1
MLCSTPSGKCETEDGLMMVAQVTLPPLIREENSTAPTEAVFETTSKYPVTKTGYYYLFMSACDRGKSFMGLAAPRKPRRTVGEAACLEPATKPTSADFQMPERSSCTGRRSG